MKTSAPLTKTQYGLYVECVNHPGEPCYNVPCFYILDGSLDEERLRQAIETVVSAHPTLFTRIELTDQGDPVQTIDDTETFSLQVEHVDDIEAAKKTMIQPFNIVGDPVRDLASFDEANSQWLTEAGTYTFRISASSRDIQATTSLKLSEYTEKTSNALAPQQKLRLLNQ